MSTKLPKPFTDEQIAEVGEALDFCSLYECSTSEVAAQLRAYQALHAAMDNAKVAFSEGKLVWRWDP